MLRGYKHQFIKPMHQTRQLAAIMFTDIAGYTALMGDNEQSAFELLNLNRQIHKPIIEQHGGQLIKEMGDGVIASFGTASDAVTAAIKIQEACNTAQRFQLRIGIHLGEVVFENNDIFGDAVNIASRVQTLAIPGSVLISQRVQVELKNKAEFKMESLGRFDFKHVAKPMEVFALTNEGLPKPVRGSIKGKVNEPKALSKKLIAVIAVAIISIAAFIFYQTYLSADNAKSTNENYLTKNPEAYEWYTKAKFRLSPENKEDIDSCILFLQKAIASDSSFAVAHAELSRAYSMKNYFIDPRGGYSEKAFVEAEKALYLNPNLAEAYFAKAYCTWTFENKFPHEKVIRAYKKAISLKPDMDGAYHQLSVVYLHVGLIDESFEAVRKAMQFNPDSKFNLVDCYTTYFWLNNKEGWEQLNDLYNKTPEHLISSFRASLWAIALLKLDRRDDAEALLSTWLKKDSSDLFINSVYAIILAKDGDKTGALKKIEFFEKQKLNTGHFHHAVYNLACAYALLGEKEKAVSKLNWVADNGFANYPYSRDDSFLKSLQDDPPYLELLGRLKITWDEMKKLAKE